jgi:lipopolysaccharide transport system permease protein
MLVHEIKHRLLSGNYWRSALALAKLSMRDQYRNSFIGMGWALLQPMVYIVVMSVVFSLLFRVETKGYIVYMLAGMMPWQFLTNTIIKGSNSIINRRGVFHQTPLPRSMFVVADVITQMYTYGITMGIAFILSVLLIGFDWSVLALPFMLVPLVVTAAAFAIICAYISAYVWDTPHLLLMAFQSLVWTVPIMYPLAMIPEHLRIYFEVNPFYILIHPIQSVLFDHAMPSLFALASAFIIAGGSAMLAYIVYRKLRRNVIYYL